MYYNAYSTYNIVIAISIFCSYIAFCAIIDVIPDMKEAPYVQFSTGHLLNCHSERVFDANTHRKNLVLIEKMLI